MISLIRVVREFPMWPSLRTPIMVISYSDIVTVKNCHFFVTVYGAHCLTRRAIINTICYNRIQR